MVQYIQYNTCMKYEFSITTDMTILTKHDLEVYIANLHMIKWYLYTVLIYSIFNHTCSMVCNMSDCWEFQKEIFLMRKPIIFLISFLIHFYVVIEITKNRYETLE